MQKVLLVPLRLLIGWGLSPRLLSILAAAMLVILRLTIGWHFYSEGIDKYKAGNWTAKPFFANAKGPFANDFRQMVWDWDGRLRLNPEEMKKELARYRDRIRRHYGIKKKTAEYKDTQVNYAQAVEQYEWIYDTNASDIEEFKKGLKRLEKLDGLDGEDATEKKVRDSVATLGSQRETIRKEWRSKAAPAFGQIDSLWKNYESKQNSVLRGKGVEGLYLPFHRPSPTGMDTSVIDRVVPYFDIAIGLCLLLGLFTPLAALAAAGFLGSVFLSQYPPSTGPSSSQYQLIEGIACLVLASTGAGRFAGLDYFLHLIPRKLAGTPPAPAT